MTLVPEPTTIKPAAQLSLDWWQVIAVAGPDRVTFLQGQLTQDVMALRPDQAVFAGWADARGRLLAVARTWCAPEAILLALPAELVTEVVRRLRLFTLRARVEISRTSLGVAAVWDDTAHGPAPTGTTLSVAGDTRCWLLAGTPDEINASLGAAGLPAASREDWQLRQICRGLPELTPATTGEFIPQMVNLDLVGGISFTKGCYSGQEIVARTRYLGRVKRRMLRFTAACPPPAPGTPVSGPRGPAGRVLLAAGTGTGCELLAVTHLDGLAGPLWIGDGGPDLHRQPLPYRIPELATPDQGGTAAGSDHT